MGSRDVEHLLKRRNVVFRKVLCIVIKKISVVGSERKGVEGIVDRGGKNGFRQVGLTDGLGVFDGFERAGGD